MKRHANLSEEIALQIRLLQKATNIHVKTLTRICMLMSMPQPSRDFLDSDEQENSDSKDQLSASPSAFERHCKETGASIKEILAQCKNTNKMYKRMTKKLKVLPSGDESSDDIEVPLRISRKSSSSSSSSESEVVIKFDPKELAEAEFVVLDTETTGMSRDDEVISVSVVSSNKKVILSSLIYPKSSLINPHAEAKHHLTLDMLKNLQAPSFDKVYEYLKAIVDSRIPGYCYNLNFDSRLINQTAQKFKLAPLNFSSWRCAMKLYTALNKFKHPVKLVDAAKECGASASDALHAHSALGDCILTVPIVEWIVSQEQETIE